MINIKTFRQAFVTNNRKQKRQQIISLKRKLNSLPNLNILNNNQIQSLLSSILQNSLQAYSQLASISIQPSVTSLLISQDQSDTLFHIINNLDSSDVSILEHSLRIVGNISYNQKVQELMDYDIIPSLILHLSNNKKSIRQLSVWVLANIAAEQQAYSTLILNNIELIDKLGDMLINDNSSIKIQLLYLFRNLIRNGETNRLVEYLSDDDLFVGIKTNIKTQGDNFKTLAQSILLDIAQLGSQISKNQVNLLLVKMEKLGVIYLLEQEQVIMDKQ